MNKELEELYTNQHDQMCKKISRMVNGIVNAEDVVQNTFVKAMTYWESRDSSKELVPWINKILYNEALTFNRQERDHGASRVWEEMVEVMETLEENLTKKLNKLLKSSNKRQILSMYFKFGYTPQEISSFTGETIHKVKDVVRDFKRAAKEIRHE